jgi:hypothetical protein
MEPAQTKILDSDSPATVTDEELFCDYLGARLQQALEVLNAAREALLAQPQDYRLAMDVMRKVYDLRDLKKQLEYQRGRLNAARHAAGLAPVQDNNVFVAEVPTDGFRAAQTEQAEKIMAALKAQPRTCPSCQAMLSRNTERCSCGYELKADVAEIIDGAKGPANSSLSS